MRKFKEIKRKTHLPDLIAAEIMSLLDNEELVPGDVLPTETTLAENFGVSRNVVREAIARLKSDGVIETIQGRGAIVKPLSERETFRIDMSALKQGENLSDLFELRRILEVEAAGIAAIRRSDTDLQVMSASIASMEGAAGFDEQRLEADALFHRTLGAATKNGYLGTIVDYLSSRLKETTKATDKIYQENDLIAITIAEHRRIFEAIKARDYDRARAAMAHHLTHAAKRLKVKPKPSLHE